METVGDFLQVMIPSYALGMAMNENDWTGALSFGYSFVSMQTAVTGLKTAIDAPRPDNSDNRSFSSGHTAAAFSGATFIHKRYGIKRAAVPYALAGFVGWSRIDADKHYPHDVLAAAVISGLVTWIFVDKYDGLQLSLSPDSVKLSFGAVF